MDARYNSRNKSAFLIFFHEVYRRGLTTAKNFKQVTKCQVTKCQLEEEESILYLITFLILTTCLLYSVMT